MDPVLAPYMQWSKHRPAAAYDLAASGVRAVTTTELLGDDVRAIEVFALSGPNDNGYAPLVDAIAQWQHVEVSRVVCAAGTSGANALVALALLSPGDEVLIETPAYDPLIGVARVAGATVRHVPRRFANGFRLDVDEIRSGLTPRTRLIVLTSPHNPSGVVIDAATLLAVGEAAEHVGAAVLVDEVYRAAAWPGREIPGSAAALDGPFIVTNSLTKAWGLAGLRVGWAVADAATAERLRRVRDVLDVIGAFPAEQIAVRAFQRLGWLTQRTARILGEQWPIAEAALRQCPALEFVAPDGGTMVFPRFRDGREADGFVRRLHEDHDTLVVPGRFFGAPSHFRLSFGGAREAVERGAAAMIGLAF